MIVSCVQSSPLAHSRDLRPDLRLINTGKAKVINRAIADMGMGRYLWELFLLCGCGWMADNLWLQVTSQSHHRGLSVNVFAGHRPYIDISIERIWRG
jgi:hypothetical protein